MSSAHERVVERLEGENALWDAVRAEYVAVPKRGDRGPLIEGAVEEYSDITDTN